jgi:hypothetical protein
MTSKHFHESLEPAFFRVYRNKLLISWLKTYIKEMDIIHLVYLYKILSDF